MSSPASTAEHPPADPAALLATVHAINRKVDTLVDHLRGNLKPLLTVDEAAALLGRSSYTTRAYIRDGRLPATRLHGTGPRGRLLVRREDLERLLDAGEVGARPGAGTH